MPYSKQDVVMTKEFLIIILGLIITSKCPLSIKFIFVNYQLTKIIIFSLISFYQSNRNKAFINYNSSLSFWQHEWLNMIGYKIITEWLNKIFIISTTTQLNNPIILSNSYVTTLIQQIISKKVCEKSINIFFHMIIWIYARTTVLGRIRPIFSRWWYGDK